MPWTRGSGCRTRSFLLTQLRREVARARRYGNEVGVALLRFESEAEVRAKFGDFYTDHLMRRIGSQLVAQLRDTDVVGALDGGYAIIHTETSLDGTQLSSGACANRCCRWSPSASRRSLRRG